MAGVRAQPRGIQWVPPEEGGQVIARKGDETSKGRSGKGRVRRASQRLLQWPVWCEDGRTEQEVGPAGKSLERRSQGRGVSLWVEIIGDHAVVNPGGVCGAGVLIVAVHLY